jgi:modulator of FtsH protease
MSAFTLAGWENFFVASAGAAAGLAGLLFVALSINLSQILKIPGLAARAGETFIPLAVTLVISLLALVPGFSIRSYAACLICIGGITWLASSSIQFHAIRSRHFVKVWHLITRLAFNQPGNLCIFIAGLSLFFRFSGGLYWLVPGVLMAFAGAMINAWILLVEILR